MFLSDIATLFTDPPTDISILLTDSWVLLSGFTVLLTDPLTCYWHHHLANLSSKCYWHLLHSLIPTYSPSITNWLHNLTHWSFKCYWNHHLSHVSQNNTNISISLTDPQVTLILPSIHFKCNWHHHFAHWSPSIIGIIILLTDPQVLLLVPS